MTLKNSPLTNRSVLITGGTGSFGGAFVRHALEVGARRVAVLSRNEEKQSSMRQALNDERLRFFPRDVTGDPALLTLAMRDVDIVVHAAAMKQIDTCEKNPHESEKVNVLGSRQVAMAAIDAGVWRAVFLSTDKAAAPNTLYGAHKMAAERAWVGANVYAAGTPTRLCATRYGNVLASAGSVIPVWRAQVERGEAITITDERMTRFWMHMDEAVSLVELAVARSRGGEVFIPKVRASKISVLADAIAPDWPRREIGIRRGEKLHELLISEDEARDALDHGTHYTIEPERTWEHLPAPTGTRLPSGFTLSSKTAPQLSASDLKHLLEPMQEAA